VALVEVTKEMVESALKDFERAASDTVMDADVALRVAENSDAATLDWCRLRDLNPRPSVYKTAALPLC
jgi:hypothetical protein